MEKIYFELRKLKPGQFATPELFKIASEIYQKYLIPFAVDINNAPCSHRKHFVKLCEEVLRARLNEPLVVEFDDRSIEAAIQEEGFKPNGEIHANFEQICSGMKKFLRQKINLLAEEQGLEKVILTHMLKLVQLFHETITKPEVFHINKQGWLDSFNKKNRKEEDSSVSANEGLVAAGGWQEGVPS